MDDNPYRSPTTVHAPIATQVGDGNRSRTGPELRAIASAQRFIIYAILGYLILVVVMVILRPRDVPGVDFIAGIVGLGTAICGLIGIVRLAANLYRSTLVGILNGLAMFLPFIGLLVLAMVNARATRVLKKHGIRVGLLGANSSDVDAIPD
jgi:hypothetical protein